MVSRQQKYPNTSTFKYYNANPKGRISSDCVIRAICTAMGVSWETVIREMTEVGIEIGEVVNGTKTIEAYLKKHGWVKMKQPRKADNTKYTGKEFCRKFKKIYKTPIVANIGGHHTVCIKDGKIHDIWDCTDSCIGNFWIKQ